MKCRQWRMAYRAISSFKTFTEEGVSIPFIEFLNLYRIVRLTASVRINLPLRILLSL